MPASQAAGKGREGHAPGVKRSVNVTTAIGFVLARKILLIRRLTVFGLKAFFL